MLLSIQPVLPWSTHRVYSVRLLFAVALPEFAYRSSSHHHGTGISGFCLTSVQADHIEALFGMTVPYTGRRKCVPRQWTRKVGDWLLPSLNYPSPLVSKNLKANLSPSMKNF
jgi:hypothetical protein